MTLPRLFIFVLLLSACGKANPRIAKIVDDKANDDPDESYDFSYDDSNRLTRIERTEGDDSQLWELTWDGSVLAKVLVREEEQGNLTEAESELVWENGRLVSSKTTIEDNETDTTYTYDDKGRLSQTESDGENSDNSTTINYDNEGRVESLESDTDTGGTLTTTAVELDRDGENITTLALVQEGNEFLSVNIDYDEEQNRVSQTSFDVEITDANGQPVVVTGISAFAYADSGLLETVTKTAEVGNTETDVSEVEITYEDGDASSLDVTPNEIFFFGIFFDMKGKSYGALDNTLSVPRTAFSSW